jgi:hypothetical protein
LWLLPKWLLVDGFGAETRDTMWINARSVDATSINMKSIDAVFVEAVCFNPY